MAVYKLEVSNRFKKSFKKLDKHNAAIIERWIDKNLTSCSNPYWSGKYLRGRYEGYWRYRIGDYRLIVKILHDKLIITAIDVGHRREVYKK